MYILLMSATEASKASAKAGSTFCLHFTALSITAWCASKCATIWNLKISYHILIFILVDLPKFDLQKMARKGLKWQTKKSIKINCPSIPVIHPNIWKTAPAKPKCSQHRWWKGSLDHLEASRAGTSSTQTWGSRSCPHAPGPNVPWSFVISHYYTSYSNRRFCNTSPLAFCMGGCVGMSAQAGVHPAPHLFRVHPAGHLVDVQRSHVGRKLSNLHHGLHPAGLQPSKLSRKDGRIMASWHHLILAFLMVATASFTSATNLGSSKMPQGTWKKKHPQSQFDPQLADLAVPGNDHHGGARPSGGWTPFF